jgi:transcriptional regulator with PAS, ATPase and Fis domain
LIEKAAGGTLFLDEIGDLENSSQVKLLRLLQEREYYPLGSDIPKKTDVRLIAATNADMQQRVEKGIMRKDLYYRLMTHHIRIPPLRNRLEDLPLLLNHFCETAAGALNKKRPAVPKELVSLLATYHFPGNIRELESMVFDAVSRSTVDSFSTAYFKEYLQKHSPGSHGDASQVETGKKIIFSGEFPTLREVEDFLINEALDRCKGNQLIASKLLGVSQSTLSRRLKGKKEEE